jgi:hypothetical protein
MGYKTLDGWELTEGDKCLVEIQDAVSQIPQEGIFEAVYMDDTALVNGWDFTIKNAPKLTDDDYQWEIVKVWKHPGAK